MTWIFLGAGGLFGVFLRFALQLILPEQPPHFPTATFLVNVLGSFAAGFFWTVAQERGWTPEMRAAVFAGFLGGLTTFSSLSLETFRLIDAGQVGKGLFYLLTSPTVGLFVAWIGVFAARGALR